MGNNNRIQVAASASRASGTAINIGDAGDWPEAWDDLIIQVAVTAVGTTLAIDYQVSLDGGTTWATLQNIITAVTGTGNFAKVVPTPIGSKARLLQTSTGSFTYQVWAEGSRRGHAG